MSKEVIVSSTNLETRLAILEDDQVTEIFFERSNSRGILGNIYKGKVTKVLPGMQAAFVDIGLDQHAFLYVTDFFEDLEEFGDFLSAGGDAADPPGHSSEPVRGRRSKRGRKRWSERKRTPPSLSPASLTVDQSSLPSAVALSTDSTSSDTASLLPAQLDLAGVPHGGSRPDPSGQDGFTFGILPERLFKVDEPARQSGESSKSQVGKPPGVAQFRAKSKASVQAAADPGINGRKPLISDMLRTGQEILVQVAKEPIGQKGPRITSYIALPGRHLVFMPTVEHVGVSRKISDESERLRLREIVLRLRGNSTKGFIVRTAGEGQAEESLAADISYLTRLWDAVRAKAERSAAPALIHSEPALVERIVRDRLNDDFRAIRVDDEADYERIVEFVHALAPDMVPRVRFYGDRKPIFDAFGVTPEIEKALKHKVWLKNGGYIVINQTEALVAIDVNTGRFVGKTDSLEDTITRTNLDAVREVVRQIRLRDLGGIVIIDFIDMDQSKNRQKVMESLQRELAKDKSPSKILKFNEFGLVALTRRRVKQSLEKALCQPCIYCTGTGVTKSSRTVAHSIHQEVRRMQPFKGNRTELLIRCHPEVAKILKDGEKQVVVEIRQMTNRMVTVKPDPTMHLEQFDLVET